MDPHVQVFPSPLCSINVYVCTKAYIHLFKTHALCFIFLKIFYSILSLFLLPELSVLIPDTATGKET